MTEVKIPNWESNADFREVKSGLECGRRAQKLFALKDSNSEAVIV